MSREENKSKFGGRLGYILNDSTALPRVTFSNGLIRVSYRDACADSSTSSTCADLFRSDDTGEPNQKTGTFDGHKTRRRAQIRFTRSGF
jgi:hypothetical protein